MNRLSVVVTTNKPSTALTAGGGGGSLTLIDPISGSIQSSLRISGDTEKRSVGLTSLSLFPSRLATPSTTLAVGFGATDKSNDTYALLMSLRSSSLSPIVHWRSRLPEANLQAGLIVSECGEYILGGGQSGTLYIWKSLGGQLLSSTKAHYRAITVLQFLNRRTLVTGGADGMVHAFSLEHLVRGGSIHPTRTWTQHQLPVTALARLGGSRMASAADDGQVVVFDVASEAVLASIQLSSGITSLAGDDRRLFAGEKSGAITMIDMDEYAMAQTTAAGATAVHVSTVREKVFGESTEKTFLVELSGHERPVTALTCFDDTLVSGDASGSVRVWHVLSRSCVRVIAPWSGQASPVTSLSCVPDRAEDQGLFERNKASRNVSSLVTPLQKYVSKIESLPVPTLRPKRNAATVAFWNETALDWTKALAKRRRPATDAEVLRVRRELEDARSTIQRWETVNQKLMSRLQQQG